MLLSGTLQIVYSASMEQFGHLGAATATPRLDM